MARSTSARHVFAAVLSMALCVPATAAQPGRARPAPVAVSIVPGPSVERALARGQSHTYRLVLAAGDFLQVSIAQRGIDVSASLIRPDGVELTSVNACEDNFRSETLVALADAAGTYRLVVRPAPSSAPRGRYTIQVDALRPATPTDNVRIEAERAFARGYALSAGLDPKAYPESIAQFNAAVARFRQLSDRWGEVKVLIDLAFRQGRLLRPEALGNAQDAERIARELGDQATIAAALHSLASVVDRLGDLPAALRATTEGIVISRTIGNRWAEARTLNVEGIVHGRSGDGEKAVASFERTLLLARATGNRVLERVALNNLGISYKNLGEFEKAVEAYRQALIHTRVDRDRAAEPTFLNNLGNVERLLGRNQLALQHHMLALTLSRASGATEDEARSLNTIGQTYYALKDYARALDYHRQALVIRRDMGDLAGQAASLNAEGQALHRLGKSEEALAALHEALAIRRRIYEQVGEANVLHALAVVERDRGHLAAAREHVEAAVDLEERVRARITSPSLRASFIAFEQDKYDLLVDVLQQQHLTDRGAAHHVAALEANERTRARVLLESALDARIDLRQGIAPALLDRERTLQNQLNDASAQLSRALSAETQAAQSKTAADRIDQLTRDYEQLQAEIRRQSPRYAAITQPRPLSAREIQHAVVDDDTVLLEFALGEDRSWMWAVTPRTIISVELPPRRTIDAAARSLYGRFTARQRRPGESAGGYGARVAAAEAALRGEAAAVSRMLFGGVAESLKADWRGKRLAIVAVGALEYLPFAALPLPDAEPGGRLPPLPFIAQHEIVMIPSASVLATLRRETTDRGPAAGEVAIVADPVFEKTDPRVGAKPTGARAEFPSAAAASSARPALRAGLSRLPFSRDEANAIASLAAPRAVFTAMDFNASRATVLEGALAGYRIVHFATHGVLDSQRPSLSGLVVSLVNENGVPVDGYLRLHDIYNMRLNAELVVLSACQTALGKEIKGEGLVGLARAFMYAGASRVVASLWEVSDLATAELMRKFYRGVLKEGLTAAAALRAAQLEMSRDSRWSSPYYWGGFTIQGEWR